MGKYFPNDLLRCLLQYLPIKSLLRFKSVSKSWCSWMDDPYFLRSRFPESNFLGVQKPPVGLNQMLMISLDSSEDHCSVEKLDLPLENHPITHLCGSCNGLSCLVDRADIIIVCNIPTKDYHIVKLPRQPDQREYKLMISLYGFGCDSINDDYKVLRINSLYCECESHHETQVYSLRKDSWDGPRGQGSYPSFLQGLRIDARIPIGSKGSNGVLAYGALHWIAFVTYTQPFTIAFNLSTEEFSKIVLPNNLSYGPVLGLLRGCLTVTCHNGLRCSDFDLWVMKDYMVSESWSKLFHISFDGWIEHLSPLAYSRSGKKILFESSTKHHLWYDVGNKQMEILGSCNGVFVAVPYFESLISVRAYKGTGIIRQE
ncbi:hypothetical protein SLE2022_189770 [Rubroshorea leprosula]